MNTQTNKMPWVVASVFAATTVFGAQPTNGSNCKPQKSFEQGHELSQSQMMAAYNAPARIDVRGSWDLFVDASFIYWQVTQDNMEPAAVDTTSTIAAPFTGTISNMSFDYLPGFKVGAGMNFDHDSWVSYAEYTWLHGTNNETVNAPAGGIVISMWNSPVNQVAFTSVSEHWKFRYDAVNWMLGRPYYVGTKLTFNPYFGLRGAFIRQNVTVRGTVSGGAQTALRRLSSSWGVGGIGGLDTNWMLGWGFRIFGDISADLLFTRYHEVGTSQNPATAAENLAFSQEHINTVRPHADLELGLGWSSYFDNNNWHFDLLAGYGFQVFWDQNVFRRVWETTSNVTSDLTHGNLYMQGLTVTARLDF